MPIHKNISVIIVTYNNEKTIKKCIDAILKYSPGAEVIIVDNASEDRTCEIVGKFRQVILIESTTNLGFAKANNLGIKKANGSFFVFLNPDAYLTNQGDLEKLRDALIENSDYGLIGPRLISLDGKVQKSVRRLPTAWKAFQEYILGTESAYDFYQPKCTHLCEVESVTGACMIVHENLFKKLKGFDEKYFLYFEDLELCKSVKNKGFKVGYLPEVKIQHLVGVSGNKQPTSKFLHTSAKKYHGLINYYLIQLIIKINNCFH